MKPFTWRFAIAALFAASVLNAAIPTNTRYNVVRTPSGKVDTRYLDGNDGTAAIPLAWDSELAAVSVFSSSTSSINLCSNYLTQPAAPGDTAVLTVETGYSLPTGFSLTGTNSCTLSWTTPSVVSTIVRIRATITAQPIATSPDLQIIVTAPPGTDTTAPPTPTGLTATPGTNQVVLEWDASCDNNTGATPSGATAYDVRLGTNIVNSPTQTGCSNAALTAYNVGTISSPGAPTSSQSGNDWDLTAAGTGLEGAATQILYLAAPITRGTLATQTVKVTTFTTGSTSFPKTGLMIAASTDANAVSNSCHVQKLSTGTIQVQMRARSTQGGNMGGIGSATLSVGLPIYLRQRIDANGIDCEYSTDGITYTAVVSDYATAVIPAVPYFGIYATSTTAGTNVSSELDGYNVTTYTRQSYTHSTAVGGSYTVRSKDANSNASAYSGAVSATPSTPSVPQVRWHPGHYVILDGIVRANNRATLWTQHSANIAEICNSTTFKGVKVFFQWSSLESGNDPNSATRFNDGVTMVRQYLDALRPCNKRLMFTVHIQQFGSGVSATGNNEAYFPTYIWSNGSGLYGITQMSFGITARMWQVATMDALIRLHQHYAAQFNNDAMLEVVSFVETSIAVASGTDGYSAAAHATQIKRYADAAILVWTKTGLRVSANYFPGDDLFADLIAYLSARRFILGGPDVLPDENVQANQLFKGRRRTQGSPIGAWGSATAGPDLRGVSPWQSEVQSPEFCGHEGCYKPTVLFDDATLTAQDAMYPQYFTWYRNTWTPCNTVGCNGYQSDWYDYYWTPLNRPTNGIKYYVDTTIQGKVTSGSSQTLIVPSSVPCPSSYAGGCDTSGLFEPELIPQQLEREMGQVIPFPKRKRYEPQELARAA